MSLRPRKLSFDEMWIAHKKYKQSDTKSFIDVVDMLYPKRKKEGTSDL
jgi:predicted CopG family antitoxin